MWARRALWRWQLGWAVLGLAFAPGCVGLMPAPSEAETVGHPSFGYLRGGAAMPDQGPGFVRARPGEETRFGTRRLVAALTRTAARVAVELPGGEPLRIGDLSYPAGGRHPRHGSHRAGRDVDLIFYLTAADGTPDRGRGWIAFDRFGATRELHAPEGGAASGDLFLLDLARNWHLVRTLLLDEEAGVQWIFCSRGVKSLLLAYGAAVERDPEVLVRAAWVLHQPSTGHPHDDHFHVRLACTSEERARGCIERGPVWPWLRKTHEKADEPVGHALDDAALVRALLDDPPPEAPPVTP